MNERPMPTERQHSVLEWITNFITEYGHAPTLQQIGDQFGMKASSVFDIVHALVKKGYVRKQGSGRHVWLEVLDEFGERLMPFSVPVIGDVAAGTPVLAFENRIGRIAVDQPMWRRGVGFALRVKGESMIEAGILPGDKVLIRPQSHADSGQIALVLVKEEEATIKRIYPQNDGKLRLHPENRTMKDMLVHTADCRIQGVVIGVFREVE